MALSTYELTSGWEFKETDGDGMWMPAARVPTNVHLDLLAQDKIEEPFVGTNELKCEWVNKTRWTYRTALPRIEDPNDPDVKVLLECEGLDTFASVHINGELLFRSDNMFIPRTVDIRKHFKFGAYNRLEIQFESAFLEGQKVVSENPHHKWICWNGDNGRLAVRKAQYHWGWDWGPALNTCGPWRPIRLEVYKARISHLRVHYTFGKSLEEVVGTISATIEGPQDCTLRLAIAPVGAGGRAEGTAAWTANDVKPHDGEFKKDFTLNDVQLWYPHGYGSQQLYEVQVSVERDQHTLHVVRKRVGFRTIKLIQEGKGDEKSFYFRVNDIDIFCGGTNWIPAHNFIPKLLPGDYHRWLMTARDGNHIMIRIWGGGIYEEDIFYNICDELGLLIWHDFMFACGNYPTSKDFLSNVRDEAVAQVRRLRHHPSIVLWAGNNEDYQVQEQVGLTYNYEDKDPESWLKTDFPARYIYEKLLPEVVKEETGDVPYHPGSPWGQGKVTTDPNVGDLHQWNVWHGSQEPYQRYPELGGRFVSEFGMQSFPFLSTVKAFCTSESDLHPSSATMDFHNKADGGTGRIGKYLADNFPLLGINTFESFIHLTQLLQSEALVCAYRGWRRQWGTPGNRQCGGAMVWQLNDVWPCISWAIVDHLHLRKPAWHAIKRALAPVAVGITREHHDWSEDGHAHLPEKSNWECWVANSTAQDISVAVRIQFVSVQTGVAVDKSVVVPGFGVPANSVKTLARGTLEHANDVVFHASLVLVSTSSSSGKKTEKPAQPLSTDTSWPQPLKYLTPALSDGQRGLKIYAVPHRSALAIKAARPVKGLVFEEQEGVTFDDNGFDVVPETDGDGDGGEFGSKWKIVGVSGVKDRMERVKYRYLGMRDGGSGSEKEVEVVGEGDAVDGEIAALLK